MRIENRLRLMVNLHSDLMNHYQHYVHMLLKIVPQLLLMMKLHQKSHSNMIFELLIVLMMCGMLLTYLRYHSIIL